MTQNRNRNDKDNKGNKGNKGNQGNQGSRVEEAIKEWEDSELDPYMEEWEETLKEALEGNSANDKTTQNRKERPLGGGFLLEKDLGGTINQGQNLEESETSGERKDVTFGERVSSEKVGRPTSTNSEDLGLSSNSGKRLGIDQVLQGKEGLDLGVLARSRGQHELDRKFLKKVLHRIGVPHQGLVREHGMSHHENMRGARVNGLDILWTDHLHPSRDKKVIEHAAATLANLHNSSTSIPKNLLQGTKRVIFSSQPNKHDAYWAARYNLPSVTSLATGGNGTIVSYNTALTPHHLVHEMGHNLAHKVWGQTDPPSGTDYMAAHNAESPVSEYSHIAQSPAEDFAEAVRRYVHEPMSLRASHPKKFAAVHKILTDSNY